MTIREEIGRVAQFRNESGQVTPVSGLRLNTSSTDIAVALVDKHIDDLVAAIQGADETQAVTEYGHLLFVVLNLGVAMVGPELVADVLDAVMDSNASRLVDPQFDTGGRLLKGGHYRPAEPDIRALLIERGYIRG